MGGSKAEPAARLARPNSYNRKQQVAFVNMQPGEVDRPGIVSLSVPACTTEERKGKRLVDEAAWTTTISPCQRPNEIVRHDRLPSAANRC
jgi:hypothetical protein